MHVGLCWGNMREGDHLGELKLVDCRIILKQIFSKLVGSAWNGLIWPRIGASVGLL